MRLYVDENPLLFVPKKNGEKKNELGMCQVDM